MLLMFLIYLIFLASGPLGQEFWIFPRIGF